MPKLKIEPIENANPKDLQELHHLCLNKNWNKESFTPSKNRFGFTYNSIALILIQTATNEAEILNVCVHPNHRQQGIAQELLQKTIQKCAEKNIEKIFLEVQQNNTPAINLYTKFNFQKIGTRKNYYKNKTDAIVMELKI